MADKIVIGLDAGHGGSSLGTNTAKTAQDGVYEKTYALELCKMVRDRLEANGFSVFMTREDDTKPGNVSERAEMCVKAGCRYAVSIHFNGSANVAAKGTEVFVPYAEVIADIESGYSRYLGEIFRKREPFARSNDYYDRNATYDKKLNVAAKVFDASTTAKKDYFGFIRTAWEKGLSADLLEVCFLTNPEDLSIYEAKKDQVATAIARSIVEGYKKIYSGEPAPEIPEETPPFEDREELLERIDLLTEKLRQIHDLAQV